MRRAGLILAVFIFAVLIILVAVAIAWSGNSNEIADRAGPGSPDVSADGLPDGSGNAGPGGEPNAGPGGEPGNARPGDAPGNHGTGSSPAGNGNTGAVPGPGSSGGAGQWPSVFNSWTGGGDSVFDCETFWRGDGRPSSPYVGDGSMELTMFLGDDKQVCLLGFDIHSDITLTIARPDGSRQVVTVVDGRHTAVKPTGLLTEELAGVLVFADHGDYLATNFAQLEPSVPTGTYTLTAEQGELSAESAIDVQPGPLGDPEWSYLKPQDTYEYAQSVRAGDQLTVLLLRFPAQADVPLAVYRKARDSHDITSDYEYVQELSTVTVNGQGWAYYKITVPDSLPPAGDGIGPDYCVVTLPHLMTPTCQPGFAFAFTLAG